jgi:hypothetical protein
MPLGLIMNRILLPIAEEVKYLGIFSSARKSIYAAFSLCKHISALAKKSDIDVDMIHTLRSFHYQIPVQVIKSIFQAWTLGILKYSLPLLAHVSRDQANKFESNHRNDLKASLGIPSPPWHVILY